MPFKLLILTDNYPSEISWELFHPRGEVIASSVDKEPLDNGRYEFEKCLGTYCAAENWYFKFVIKDSYGDGIIRD